MRIKRVGPQKYRLDVRRWVDGVEYRVRETIVGSRAIAKSRGHAIYQEIGERAEGSLTSRNRYLRTCHEVLEYLKANRGYGTMASTFGKLDTDQGRLNHAALADRFPDYLRLLGTETVKSIARRRKGSTVNRYLACARRAYAFALRRGKVPRNPLLAFDYEPEEARDRVLSADEETRLRNTLTRYDSDLYWGARVSLRNDIRAGDLFSLTWENLDRTKPWIHFYPSKTRRKRARETCLPFLEPDVVEYFDRLQREHPDNPYLFPYIRTKAIRGKWGREIGRRVTHIGKRTGYKRHWAWILKKADIRDFHWHDMKHCALTWAMDNGCTERDVKNLGWQYTDAMIDRYYHADASKVLAKFKGKLTGLQTGHFVAEGEKDAVSA